MIELNKIYNSECVEFLSSSVPDNFIDLTFTSPPYDKLRSYHEDWEIDLHRLGQELYRTTKDGGMVVMIIQDQTKDAAKSLTSFRTTVDWCDNIGWRLFECCIYERGGTVGAWWTRRFRVDHEYIMIFLKGKKPNYFFKEHMKIPVNQEYKKINESKNFLGGRSTDGEQIKNYKVVKLNDTKCCGTVMHYKNSARESGGAKTLKKKHPATFPDKLASDFIQAFTTKGMIVYDPMAGSGTTLVEANKLNRKWFGSEVSNQYVEDIIKPRIDEVTMK